MNREQKELCQDEGVCYVCGRTIKWGVDAVYSIWGSHYDCEYPQGRPLWAHLDQQVKKAQALVEDSGPPRLAVANGGSLLHWVNPFTGRALCGHKPADNAWRMKKRGKWLYFKDGADVSERRWCEGCRTRREAQLENEIDELIN